MRSLWQFRRRMLIGSTDGADQHLFFRKNFAHVYPSLSRIIRSFEPSITATAMTITLATVNARYTHASLGLRYLYANLGALRDDAEIAEFTLESRPLDIVEALLQRQPKIIGFGVYIWNVTVTTEVVSLLKRVRPDVMVVVGGPEVSYEWEQQPIVAAADYLVTGAADIAFAQLCAVLLAGHVPPQKVIHALPVDVNVLELPYRYYTDEDVAHRVIYVEASRGCPFKCEFCLSALDKTAWPFDLDQFLAEMDALYARGVRQFKFVDRTFNLSVRTSIRILEFFLARLDERLFVHFEVVPDHLPDALKDMIARFPPGPLQFEVGIQTFDPVVQARISRRQDNDKAKTNLRWLRNDSGVHIHADLIAGLPGEDLASFAAGFNALVELSPHEIQVGILKRLRGAPIRRHTDEFGLVFNPAPPYNVVATADLSFVDLQRLTRFARYWDLIANSGRFPNTLALLLRGDPFARFMAFSDWLYQASRQTHKIALDRLFAYVYEWLKQRADTSLHELEEVIGRDFSLAKLKHGWRPDVAATVAAGPGPLPARQSRHAQSTLD